VDALVLVVRDFKNPAIPGGDKVDPAGDLRDVRSELILADLASVERRLEKLVEKSRKPAYTDDDERERGLLARIRGTLEADQGVGALGLSPEDQKRMSSFGFLSGKPFVTVLNSETGTHPPEEMEALRAIAGGEALAVAARSEREILELPEADRSVFLEEYGIQRFMRDPLIQAIYRVAGRIGYFTAGDKEVRAWTILLGDTAPRAAGAIHTDFERGFIRAEVVSYEDYIRFGGIKGAKEKGHYRLEGREYVVKEADIVEFRFSV
jgi:ribosome-binding ATPase YchF (GTP1/OBG family)